MSNDEARIGDTGSFASNDADLPRKTYHAPKLISLGPIHTIVQSSGSPGTNGCGACSAAS